MPKLPDGVLLMNNRPQVIVECKPGNITRKIKEEWETLKSQFTFDLNLSMNNAKAIEKDNSRTVQYQFMSKEQILYEETLKDEEKSQPAQLETWRFFKH